MFDFHIHSSFSDGSMSVYSIFEQASRMGAKAIAITDHDTILGIEQEMKYSKKFNIPFVTAAEFTAEEDGLKFHILAYNINVTDELIDFSKHHLEELNKKSLMQISLLRKQGYPILEEEFFKESGGGPLYRGKLLKTLCNYGYLKEEEIMTSLNKFFGKGGICYVKDSIKYPDFATIVELIKRNGGYVVFAHPQKVKMKNESLYYKILENNLIDGVEVYHPSSNKDLEVELLKEATKRQLLITGGSDFHGIYNKLKTPLLGIDIPNIVYEKMKSFLIFNNTEEEIK